MSYCIFCFGFYFKSFVSTSATFFEQAPYAETEADWEMLLPWNIKITPFQIRDDWMDN